MDAKETKEVTVDLVEILVSLLQPNVIAENDLTAPPPTRDEYLSLKREFDEADAAGKRDLQQNACEKDNEFREFLIAEARRGVEQAHFTLWWDALWCTACAVPLPPPLQEYMTVDAPAFKRHHGRQVRPVPTYEDQCIAGMVSLLIRNGFNPYRHRNSQSDTPTACSVVAGALREAADTLQRRDLKKTENAVAKIFERCQLEREEAADRISDFIKERAKTTSEGEPRMSDNKPGI
jgi:hypothetical protein